MNKTKKKIIEATMALFNKNGVGAVRLEDIAKKVKISKGNLNYHFRTKKDLTIGVLEYMGEEQKKRGVKRQALLEKNNWVDTTLWHLEFHVGYIFFYRDLVALITVYPEAKKLYEKQIEIVYNFTMSAIDISIERGEMVPERHKGHYNFCAKSLWAHNQIWLFERAIFGSKKIKMEDAANDTLEILFHDFTEKGKNKYSLFKR